MTFLDNKRINDLNRNMNLGSIFIFKAATLPNHESLSNLQPLSCCCTVLIKGIIFSSKRREIQRDPNINAQIFNLSFPWCNSPHLNLIPYF